MRAASLFERVWKRHVITTLGEDWALLHIDRHLLHDLSGTAGLYALAQRGLAVANPELAFATPDHAVSSAPGRTGLSYAGGAKLYAGLKGLAAQSGIQFFDLGEPGQGIVHVAAPEQGITLPGSTLVCGDSHTCTNGGLGALAFGIGSSEVAHVLATQTLWQQRPKTMRASFDGRLPAGISAKDLILYLIGQLGANGAGGYAVEYAGEAIEALSIEARMTICNLSIELGAKIGMVAPDDTTFGWIEGRPFAPKGDLWARALADWRSLSTGAAARFDREHRFDARRITPMMTWGTSPEHVIPVDGVIPSPDEAPDAARREAWRRALDYMGLEPGKPLLGTTVDWVFIGSCTNSRLSDLRDAAQIVRGRRVAAGVKAWVVPGSENVKREAQAEGLDRVFLEAGFEWREPGCSMCVAANGEVVPPARRVISTSNRNFVGRQGPGARTHLASPQSAAAAAVTGVVTDIRSFAHG